jgi:hypothetical protein
VDSIFQAGRKSERLNYCWQTRYIILTVSFFAIMFFIDNTAKSADSDKLIIELDSTQLNLYVSPQSKSSHVTLFSSFMHGSYRVSDWEVEQTTPTQFRLRHKSWKHFFWSIDREQKKVWHVKGDSLKDSGSDARLLDKVAVTTPTVIRKTQLPIITYPSNTATKLSPSESDFAKDVQINDATSNQHIAILLKVASPQLIVDQHDATVRLIFEGAVLSNDEAWEVRRISAGILHFRFKARDHSFWQIDLSKMNLFEVWEGKFGFAGGRFSRLSENLHKVEPDKPVASGGILPDIEMSRYQEKPPKSLWQESEKALNETVLKKRTYDVLIVPFQVSGYAIDRIDRALMTRYLSRALETSTDLKFPSPTLVMRTLGESSRTFNDYDVFQLANKLGVKKIIRGYVGHNLNEQMNITMIVQIRSDQEYFSPTTKSEKYEWRDITISDERTPGEAFASILHDVTARLQLTKTKKKAIKATLDEESPVLPSDIRELVTDKSTSPIVRAYYLQLLGMLHPEQSVTKEQLFARSLVVLQEVSPHLSAFKVLKARALFHLYRRPAAVAVLGEPKSAEEHAVSAVLDGNLMLLEQSIKDIKNPLLNLISQIELFDLLWSYSGDQARSTSIDAIVKHYPGWEAIIARRVQHRDNWKQQTNLEIKKELDRLFPIDDFTIQNIIKNKLAIGDISIDDDDVLFSVYNHYRRLLEKQPESWVTNESATLVKRDMLDLMVSIGESNLLKKIRLRRWQALNEDIISLADRYEAIYQGHPEIAHQKAIALSQISYTKQGQAQRNLREEASQLHQNACFWSQGQTGVAPTSCINNRFYAADFPRRPYWKFSNDPKALSDRKYRGSQELTQRGTLYITLHDRTGLMNNELSLMYTQTDFSAFSAYYETLLKLRMNDEAATLLKKNSHRFIGNTARTSFFARLAEKEGDIQKARALYEDAIASQPGVWNPYEGLSGLLIRQGDYKAASKVSLTYPLFVAPKDGDENSSISTVSLSNYAYDVGSDLWWSGYAEEAKPLFTVSAGYDTGSSAGMRSATFLAILERDFYKAAQIALTNAKRYNQPKNYNHYAELLHVMGYHDEAWSAFTQIQNRTNNTLAWSPVLVGHRMEGRTTDEQLQWLKKQPAGIQTSSDATTYIFLINALDRVLNSNLSKLLLAREEQIRQSQNQNQPFISQNPKQQAPASPPQDNKMKELLQKHGDPMVPLAEGYTFLKKRKFSEAYAKLKVRFSEDWIRKDMFSFAMPYLIWSAAKSENVEGVDARLAEYKNALSDDFDYYLSKAFLLGSKKGHQEAIKNLKFARNHILNLNGVRILPEWYQLMEACEWLYEDSKNGGYRELLVEYARMHQTIRPMDSWAYAFEAKHTNSTADRTRALALTLYLDKQSERIEHFSKKEKTNALEWLKNNNPFLQAAPEKRNI